MMVGNRHILLLGALWILLFSLCFEAWLTIGSLQNNHVFDSELIDADLWLFLRDSLLTMVLIAFLATLTLIWAFYRMPILDGSGKVRKKWLSLILIFIIGIAQITYSYNNMSRFKEVYISINYDNNYLIAEKVQQEINQILKKGVPFEDLHNNSPWLNEIARTSPLIERLTLSGLNNQYT